MAALIQKEKFLEARKQLEILKAQNIEKAVQKYIQLMDKAAERGDSRITFIEEMLPQTKEKLEQEGYIVTDRVYSEHCKSDICGCVGQYSTGSISLPI